MFRGTVLTGAILKPLQEQIPNLALRQASTTPTNLLSTSSTSAARTTLQQSCLSQRPKLLHTRSGASATQKPPPIPSSINPHNAQQPVLPANASHPHEPPPPSAVPLGRSHPKYNATARRYLSIMVGVPIIIVTSYILFQRVVMGKEQRRMVPQPAESPAVAEK